MMLLRLGIEARRRDDLNQARSLVEEGRRLHRKVGFKRGEAQALSVLAGLELADGNDERGFELGDQAAALSAECGFTWWQANTLISGAYRLLERGRFAEAEEGLQTALPLLKAMSDRQDAVYALALSATLELERGRFGRVGRLWGAIEAEEARAPLRQWDN